MRRAFPLAARGGGIGLQSALICARFTMSLHTFCSRAMKAAYSAVGPPPLTALSVAKRSVTALERSALDDSSWILRTTSAGVPAGTWTPYHCDVSKSL